MRRGMKYIIAFDPPLRDGRFFGPFASRFGAKDWAARKLIRGQQEHDRVVGDGVIIRWTMEIVFQPTPMPDSIGEA